jgi:D-glycero-D-manno-heptose 1,7-bisphosphate phosphatase
MISNLKNNSKKDLNKMLILDRDGTIIENVPYLSDPSKIKFMSGVISGLQLAGAHGFKFVIASNQSGIGRNLITFKNVEAINKKISRELKTKGIILDEYIYCPHLPIDNCNCRKPNNGMIEEIIKVKKCDRCYTFFIGDSLSDVEAASKSRIKSYLLNDSLNFVGKLPNNSFLISSFDEAITHIIKLST